MTPALIVIDMQNAFLHPDGENFYPAAPEVIVPARALIDAAATSGAVMVHVADRHRHGFADFEQPKLPVHGVSGGFDAEFFDGFGPQGRPREIEIVKRRYSAFFGTDLALFLREQGIDTLVICGVKTNVCVRATAQDAFGHGFVVNVVRDAVNTNRAHLGAASLEDIERYLGHVIGLDDALGMFG
jgi:maleamate amidohydrolase